MKKDTYRSLLICLLLFLFIGMSIQEGLCQEQKQMAIVNKMKKKDPKFRIRWDEKTGVPARLIGIMSTPIDAPPKGIAYQFLKENENLFKMTDSQKELQLLRVKKDARRWNHVKLQQTYKSLNVDGRTIVVHIDADKKVRVVNGYYVPNIDVDTTAKVKDSKAVDIAKKKLKPKEKITEKPKSELVVYNFKGKTYLTWKVVLISRDPMGEFIYYVDAHTGKVVYMYNDMKIACVRQTYDAKNLNAIPGTLKRSEGDGPVNDADLDGAHDNMGTVCDLYNSRYNRDSYNNAGATIVTTVHFQVKYNNAFWSPYYQQFVFGDGDGTIFAHIAQSLDVVAHEFTHAVTENESCLVYHDEPGALNESLSDIFALMADPGDWLMGEDCYTPGTPGDALRYMDDPPRGGQPDHMDDFVTPDPTGSQMDRNCYNSGDRNNGCVHFNSGIPNKAAYLMAVGGTHRGIKVSAIGLDNVLNIFYEVQDNDWLTKNSQFMDARDATLDAAEVLFPGNTAMKCSIQDAWAAVGVGNPSPCQPYHFALTFVRNKIKKNESVTFTATLTTGKGDPIPGKEIKFSSVGPSIAKVSPAAAVTDNNGKAQVTVTGIGRGNTTINATTVVDSDTATATAKVIVTPIGSTIGLIMLVLLLGFIFIMYFKKQAKSAAQEPV